MPAEKDPATKSENRRSNKPLMEKRRRARINHSLSELKNLILDAIKQDNSRSSKLEKADILEMAVRHLQNLQKQQQQAVSASIVSGGDCNEDVLLANSNVHNKYQAGYNKCAKEVSRFLETVDGIDSSVRGRLVGHLLKNLNETCSTNNNESGVDGAGGGETVVHGLGQCPRTQLSVVVDNNDSSTVTGRLSRNAKASSEDEMLVSPASTTSASPVMSMATDASLAVQPIHVQIPANTSIPLNFLSQQVSSCVASPNNHHHHHDDGTSTSSSPIVTASSAALFHGLQLIPTRLASGEIAFLVPTTTAATGAAGACELSAASTSATASSSSSRRTCLILSTATTTSTSTVTNNNPLLPSTMAPRVSTGRPATIRANHNASSPSAMKEEPVWRPW